MQKVIVAPDSFKGSLSARQVADIIAEEIDTACAECAVVKMPLADGGEGSVEAVISAVGGRIEEASVLSPDDRQIAASFGISPANQAVLELAQSSGIMRQEGLHPMTSSTYGFGQLIVFALDLGLRDFLLCIGGSATTDAGCGMGAALGVAFLDERGDRFIPNGATLGNIAGIDMDGIDKRALESNFTVLCDVDNPLFGSEGAAFVYAPQKGADSVQVCILDDGLRHVSEVFLQMTGIDYARVPGAGAAGGLGFGCMAMLNAKITSGIDAILEVCGFDEHIADADLVITGEGRLDEQSLSGKALSGILRHAGNVPVASICGICACPEDILRKHGVTAFETSEGISPEESLANPEKYLRLAAAKASRALF